MLLKKIRYSQLFSFGQFQNETIGLEAELELGEDPKKAMRLLKVIVINIHNLHQRIRDVELEIKQVQSQIDMDNYVIGEHKDKELSTGEQIYYDEILTRTKNNTDKIKELKDTLAKLQEI